MASPRRRDSDDEPAAPARRGRSPYESGTRRILRDNDEPKVGFNDTDSMADPWASEAPQSLLSVASWLVDSVRGIPESKPPVDAPSITVSDVDLTAEELAAIDAEWIVEELFLPVEEAPLVPTETELEVEHVELSSEEAEAIDDFDLAPLRQSFERGDHLALLAAAEALLAARPTMSAAVPYLSAARESLRRRYITELGGQREVPERVPGVVHPARLDREEALVFDLIDGQTSLEEIVDRSDLSEVRALQLVDRLCALGLVVCGARHARYC